jgi:nitrogen fixation protein FixH
MSTASDPPASRLRLPWAFVPAALLLTSALGVGGMAIVAVRDPNFATEPDYYQKAIRWDQTQAQAAENQRLGYRLVLPESVKFDERGRATVELKLSDRQGQSIRGARIVAEAFANAYSGDINQLAFSERTPGVYQASLTVHHRGVWVFRISALAGATHFTADLRTDLVPGGAA